VQVDVYALCALNPLTMIEAEVNVVEGYSSGVNLQSYLWLEWLFWTFRRLSNTSSFIATEQAAQCVRCEQCRTCFSLNMSCHIYEVLMFLWFSFIRLCSEVKNPFEK